MVENTIQLTVERVVDISRQTVRAYLMNQIPLEVYSAVITDLVERTPDKELIQVINLLVTRQPT